MDLHVDCLVELDLVGWLVGLIYGFMIWLGYCCNKGLVKSLCGSRQV